MMTSENPAPAPLTASEPYVSAHGRAMVVVALFVAYIVVTLLFIATTLLQFTTSPAVLAGGEGADGQVTLNDLLMLLVGLATVAVYISLAVAFLVWLHRVSKNIPALGNPKSRVEYSPGWAVGSFFIPFANLFMPYRAVREVWEKSDPSVRNQDDFMFAPPSSGTLLFGWWVSWVAMNIIGRITSRLPHDEMSLDTMGWVTLVDVVGDLIGIVSAVLAILVVRDIDRRQQERARHVAYVPHTPPPPPLFTPPRPQGV